MSRPTDADEPSATSRSRRGRVGALLERMVRRGSHLPAILVPMAYVTLLLLLPSRLVVPQIGAPGTPANLVAITGLVVWVCLTVGGLNGRKGWTPTRATVALFTLAVLASLLSGNQYGWYQPADIHQRSDRLWRSVPLDQLSVALDSAGARGLLALAGWMGVLLLTAEAVRSWRDLERVVGWVVGCATVVAVLGVYQYFTGDNVAAWYRIPGLSTILEQNTFTRSVVNRVVVTAGHPIELGVVMSALLPLALHRALHRRTVMGWAQSAMIGVVALMSVSRSAVVVMAVALLVLFLGWPPRRRLAALVILPVAAVVARAALPGLLGTIQSLFTNLADDPSVAGRTADYDIVARAVSERPLFGQGLFTWVPFYFRTIDNQALMFLLELGIVGTAAFGLLVATHLALALVARSRLADDRARDLALAVAAGLFGILASYVTFDALSFRLVAGITFLLAGLAGGVWHVTRDPSRSTGVLRDAGQRNPRRALEPLSETV